MIIIFYLSLLLLTLSISTEMLLFDDALVLALLMVALLGIIINKAGKPFVNLVHENSTKLTQEFSIHFTRETDTVRNAFINIYATSTCVAFLNLFLSSYFRATAKGYNVCNF
jgi:hypothetical protein